MPFSEIEKTDLNILLDLEVLDSRIDDAFESKKQETFIDDIF